LRYLYLEYCGIDDTNNLTILENCTSLQELRLLYNRYPGDVLKLPSNLIKLTCFGVGTLKSVNALNCTQLKNAYIRVFRNSDFKFIPPLTPCLRTLKMMEHCILDASHLRSGIFDNLSKLILDSRTLESNYKWFYGNDICDGDDLCLHLELYPQLKKLCITIDNDFQGDLNCTFPCGNGIFHLELDWPNFKRPTKIYKINLDPQNPTTKPILNKLDLESRFYAFISYMDF